ncbi:MAG: hypothetical protein J6E42_07820, partial [Firmicutes bacterium]|nr:hypothetical protein [Bacillota bacterium]
RLLRSRRTVALEQSYEAPEGVPTKNPQISTSVGFLFPSFLDTFERSTEGVHMTVLLRTGNKTLSDLHIVFCRGKGFMPHQAFSTYPQNIAQRL